MCSISQTSPLFPNSFSSEGRKWNEKKKMEGGNEGVGVIGSEKAGSLDGPVKLLV